MCISLEIYIPPAYIYIYIYIPAMVSKTSSRIKNAIYRKCFSEDYKQMKSLSIKGTPSIPETYLSSSVAWGLNLRVG